MSLTRQELIAYSKEYNRTHKEENKTRMREYYRNNNQYKTSQLMQKKYHYKKSKLKLFEILGSQCVRCGFDDKRALQFDHIEGGGSQERKEFKGKKETYRHYASNPELAKQKLQVLCANCNWIKRAEKQQFSNR